MASVAKSRTWGQNQQHNSIKNILKKNVKMQLLPSFVEMIHLRIVVDDLNRHQTWSPPLLEKENLTTISINKF